MTADGASASPGGPRSPWPAFFTASIGAFMGTIDGSIVNLALPAFADPSIMPRGTFPAATWVVISFYLTGTATLLTGGRLGDQFGRRRIYIAGIVTFTIASALCAFAPDIRFLIGARVLQGFGAALLVSNGASILVQAFPPRDRGKALGLFGTVIAAGLSVGPPLGGLLLSDPNRWPWIFLINLPVGVLGVPLALWALPREKPAPRIRFDITGAVLLAVALGSLGLLAETLREGFDPVRFVAFAVVLVAAAAGFLSVERRAAGPIVELGLFRNWNFSLGSLAVLATFMALQSLLILVPYYLRDLGGLPMPVVGFVLLASPLSLSVVAPLSGWISDRIGTRTPATIGMCVTAAAYLLFGLTLQEDPRPVPVMLRLFLIGVGMGMFVAPNNSAVMSAVPPERLGTAGGLIATMRNLGSSLGGAMVSILFSASFVSMAGIAYSATNGRANPESMLTAMRVSFLVSAGFALLAATLCLVERRRVHTPPSGA